jgi:hypothetical protein
MTIFNVSAIAELIPDKNHYTRIKIRNLMSGFRGGASRSDIQNLRKLIKKECDRLDKQLSLLEEQK